MASTLEGILPPPFMALLANPPLWILVLLIVTAAAAVEAVGHRLGTRSSGRNDDATRTHAATVLAASLGLLTLLIGFSFSMAVSRYEGRRQLVIKEANAIGTTWLRGQMLGPARDSAVTALLRRYVDIRVSVAVHEPEDEELAGAIRASHAIHDSLWQVAREVAAQDQRMAVISLFTTTLNDMIDVDGERLAAYQQRVPAAILWGLLLTSWFTLGLGGYVTGLGGARQRWLNLSVTILFALFIGLIADLDRPRGGYIQTPYQSLSDLQAAMRPGTK